MGAAEIFTFPWPGPGNSEGPVDPEGWMDVEGGEPSAEVDVVVLQSSLVVTSPWPGPGDSEG
jgi:hypothetical protein